MPALADEMDIVGFSTTTEPDGVHLATPERAKHDRSA
jgi:hypothetical protein